jgi:hypothetical protein
MLTKALRALSKAFPNNQEEMDELKRVFTYVNDHHRKSPSP